MRKHLLRLLPGLALAAALTLPGCGVVVRSLDQAAQEVSQLGPAGHVGRHGRLTPRERQWARTAWKYFENNTSAHTGLVHGADQQPVTTPWQLGDTLAALVAAHQIGLIDTLEFDRRLSRQLAFLNRMQLGAQGQPARAYDTHSGEITRPPPWLPEGEGWSAIELGRLLTWMKITGHLYPQFREYLDKAVLRWNFCPVIDDCGVLYGQGIAPGRPGRVAEGRLGSLQYASAGFAAWGFETRESARVAPVETLDLLGIKLRYDGRDDRRTGQIAPVQTLPHALLGLEFGWRPPGLMSSQADAQEALLRDMAFDVFRVQERRYREQGVLTARTDHALRRPPYLLHDAVFASGYPWNTLSPQGEPHLDLALVSTRAAFGMWALWPGDYTDRLIGTLEALQAPGGWYEGRYEQSGGYEDLLTLSTNAMVLQALLYKVRGPLYPAGERVGYFDHRMADRFAPLERCMPSERQACTAPPAVVPGLPPARP